jgi:hypothetical protein
MTAPRRNWQAGQQFVTVPNAQDFLSRIDLDDTS